MLGQILIKKLKYKSLCFDCLCSLFPKQLVCKGSSYRFLVGANPAPDLVVRVACGPVDLWILAGWLVQTQLQIWLPG